MLSLRLVVLTATLMSAIACGGGYPSPPTTPAPTPSPAPGPGGSSSAVAIQAGAEALANRAYAPSELDVAAGTTVIWTNADAVAHTSTSDAAGWNSGSIGPGGRFSFTFPTAGTFEYHCTIHPGMVGKVVVR